MTTDRALRVGLLVIAISGAASAEIFQANIVTEDGSPLPTSPQIIPSRDFALQNECQIINILGSGSVNYVMNYRNRSYDPATADMCAVTIRLKGFQPLQTTLRNHGTVVLKHNGSLHEGSTVTATSLNAPESARKAFGKGVNAMEDGKLDAAQKDFEKAVEVYPQYAMAWSDLGEVLRRQAKPGDARTAMEKAVAADPKYIKAYVQLAMLGLDEKKVEDAAAIAGRAVAMNPLEFPQLYFYNAVANFDLRHMDVAEVSARRATELDAAHEIPRAELLLGTILAAKGDRPGALDHMRKYLDIAPKAPDAAQVQRAIDQLLQPRGDAK